MVLQGERGSYMIPCLFTPPPPSAPETFANLKNPNPKCGRTESPPDHNNDFLDPPSNYPLFGLKHPLSKAL